MRIGILTFFESDNYGTVLQAYALQDYLAKLGHQPVLIQLKRNIHVASGHYKSPMRVYTLLQRAWIHTVLKKYADCEKIKKERFAQFRDCFLNRTEKIYENGQALLQDISHFDLIISGGDQIWNPYHKVFSMNYMCNFLPDNFCRISYGSSFGVDRIDDSRLCEQMARALKQYSFIGVRENSGAELIRNMGLQANQVLDPVFLNTERWKEIASERVPQTQKYGIVYALVDYEDQNDGKIREYAKANRLDMVILPENRRNCLNRYQKKFALSPLEFVNYIAHSEAVFTNSFHGLAFGIVFRKKLVLLDPISEEAKKKQIRLTDLLNSLGIQNYRWEDASVPTIYDEEKIHGMIAQSQKLLRAALQTKKRPVQE